jgi:heme-degrading monooxygenase HmoA
MIAVIFEVEPSDRDAYFRIAGELRPLLDEIDGFVSIERFQSLSDDGRVLSLSFWRDEAAVAAWRNVEAHRVGQAAGRGGVFRNYRCGLLKWCGIMGCGSGKRRRRTPSSSWGLAKPRARDPGDRKARLVAPGSRLALPRDPG